jgi:biopolymer transport protein ExbB
MEHLRLVIDYGIIGLLLLLSVVSIAIGIERFLVFRHLRLQDFTDRRELEVALTTRLHLIATVGANAPYLGLLGTVLGIMLTFQTMGVEGLVDTRKIMIGLALALKATAVGLVVAIPAVVIYNLLLRRVKVLLLRWEVDHEREGV